MPRQTVTEEEARILFAKQISAQAEEGPDPDCERSIAEIIAENEAECAKMELDFTSSMAGATFAH